MSRDASTSSTVIGSRYAARGFLAAHRRCATATYASCSWVSPKSFMYRSAVMVKVVVGPKVPYGASNCPAGEDREPRGGGPPTRDRPDSPCVTSTVLA